MKTVLFPSVSVQGSNAEAKNVRSEVERQARAGGRALTPGVFFYVLVINLGARRAAPPCRFAWPEASARRSDDPEGTLDQARRGARRPASDRTERTRGEGQPGAHRCAAAETETAR
jgi:hypothetical protein